MTEFVYSDKNAKSGFDEQFCTEIYLSHIFKLQNNWQKRLLKTEDVKTNPKMQKAKCVTQQ